MSKFEKLKEVLKNQPKETQRQVLLKAAKDDPSLMLELKRKAQEIKNLNEKAKLGTDTYRNAVKEGSKNITLTPTDEILDMNKGLKGRLTSKQKLIESYKNDPFPPVEKKKIAPPPVNPEDQRIKAQVDMEIEAEKLRKQDLSKKYDIDNSNKATQMGLGKKTGSNILENLFSKGTAKSVAKQVTGKVPMLGGVVAGLMAANDSYASTGSFPEAIKTGGKEFLKEEANITPIPTEIIEGAIEDRDSIKKDLMLDSYKKDAEDSALKNYTNSQAKQDALKKMSETYADGGIPFKKMSPEQKEIISKLFNTYTSLIDSSDDAGGEKLRMGMRGLKRDFSSDDVDDVKKYSSQLDELDDMVDGKSDPLFRKDSSGAKISKIKDLEIPQSETKLELEPHKKVKSDLWDTLKNEDATVKMKRPTKDIIKEALENKKTLSMLKNVKGLGALGLLAGGALEAKDSIDEGDDIERTAKRVALSAIPLPTDITLDALENYEDYDKAIFEDKYKKDAVDKAKLDYMFSPASKDKAKSGRFNKIKLRLK